LDQVTVATVAGLDRDGVFTERGYKSSARALSDLLGWGAVRGLRDNLPDEIDLLFLDGAKEMYCEVLAMLEPRLAPGALVVALPVGGRRW